MFWRLKGPRKFPFKHGISVLIPLLAVGWVVFVITDSIRKPGAPDQIGQTVGRLRSIDGRDGPPGGNQPQPPVPRGRATEMVAEGDAVSLRDKESDWRQLPTRQHSWLEMGVPPDLGGRFAENVPGVQPGVRPGRRIPDLVPFDQLQREDLSSHAVSLARAETGRRIHFRNRTLGRVAHRDGRIRMFAPETVLVRFRGAPRVSALRVERDREWDSVRMIRRRDDVLFAELDTLQRRQFEPNDSDVGSQWHHATIGSFSAWDFGLGDGTIRIAIVDTAFQMDHPDLEANTDPGWSVITDKPVTAARGISHSTIGAGMAAAVVNNSLGVAGAGNFRLVPIEIDGFISEMHEATNWAADHGIRVVNISWSGADSAAVNEGGAYLRDQVQGVLVMAGVNGSGFLNYPDHPDIQAISMTDERDVVRSKHGDHIDFAAPGHQILSTTTFSRYTTENGTSHSAPLFAGAVAMLFNINPALDAGEAVALLRETAVDAGESGRDPFYGWGRLDFAAAAAATRATLPRIVRVTIDSGRVRLIAENRPNRHYRLWQSARPTGSDWVEAEIESTATNESFLVIELARPAAEQSFYRLEESRSED